ncbi:MAG: LamG domain-containing protein, partial [Clostridiales bacterium]|nr:LamG domain-containing protein [Clostridiales bacterium]
MKIVRRLLAFMLVFLLASTSFLSEGVIFADEEDYYEEELDDYGDEEEASVSKTNSIGDYRGLVAHWKFDGDLKDSSPFGNHGVAIGGKSGVTFVDGVLNKGVKLDGKSYIEVADSDSLDLSDAFTISFWVYKDEMRKGDYMEGGVPYVIKYNDDNLPFSYGVYEWWHLIPSVSFYDGEEEHFINAGQQVDIQKWTLITATYDGKSVRIYHDKQLVKSELKSASIKNSSQPLHIGYAYFMVTDNFLKGVLDDMRIYNKALSY